MATTTAVLHPYRCYYLLARSCGFDVLRLGLVNLVNVLTKLFRQGLNLCGE